MLMHRSATLDKVGGLAALGETPMRTEEITIRVDP
jgi:hypothetical protein